MQKAIFHLICIPHVICVPSIGASESVHRDAQLTKPEFLPYADSNLSSIIDEYCRISLKDNPSDVETDRLIAILELGDYDEELRSLIQIADHLITYEIGLPASTHCS